MIHLFVNSLAATAGGGLTYIRNVIRQLAATPDLRVTAAVGRGLRQEFGDFSNINFEEIEIPTARRFWYEQSVLGNLIRRSGANVLLSAGNFALRKTPVPQILLSRNSVYTSPDFYHDLWSRHEYGTWLDTHVRGWLAKRSIQWADVTVAPSEAFAAELRRWTGRPVQAIHHGFDPYSFFRDSGPPPADVQEKLTAVEGSLKLLFVSHYNYYRNFETLLRALSLLREKLPGGSIKLLLTCKLAAGENPGSYRPESAAKLVNELEIGDMVVELGGIPYHRLHHVYRSADIYVTPAYTETFAHPLVEAMASGVPVVASDLAVHREICGEAGKYFPRFSPESLAESVAQVSRSQDEMRRMTTDGLERSKHFSWKKHVEKILELAAGLANSKSASTY